MILLFSDGAGIFRPDAKCFHHQLEGDISCFYEHEKTTVLDTYSAPPGSQWLFPSANFLLLEPFKNFRAVALTQMHLQAKIHVHKCHKLTLKRYKIQILPRDSKTHLFLCPECTKPCRCTGT